jgi:hypothetical protein
MHFASFDLGDPIFDAFDLRCSVQIVTLENLYGVDPETVSIDREGDLCAVTARGLVRAGGQQRAPGEVKLRLERIGAGGVRAWIRAAGPEPVRCVKLLLRDLDPPLQVLRGDGDSHAVGELGELLVYPTLLPIPVVHLRAGGRRLGLRAEDERVREKRFALSLEKLGELAGRGVAELIHEEDGSRFAREIAAPPFVIARDADIADFDEAYLDHAERALGLVPWEHRADVAPWVRELRLVVTLHGMHWSGRIFLDYAEMLEILRFVAQRIDHRHVLAYLPGWEGRYYWQYGDYRPDERLGGARGFDRLCQGARALGVKLMPMFGANCVNARLPRFRDLEPDLHLKSATGSRFHGNRPDWDLARAHDPGWQVWLNPGHPAWREELAGQIEGLAGRHGLDAVFLDTAHAWINDADHPVTDGLRALAQRLRRALPGVLLAAEADYDALLGIFPLFQRPWWAPSPPWTARYVRRFGHLCEGEPEGRTGVHEFGIYRAGAVPAAPGLLATLAFQDGTLERSRPQVEEVIAAAAESI